MQRSEVRPTGALVGAMWRDARVNGDGGVCSHHAVATCVGKRRGRPRTHPRRAPPPMAATSLKEGAQVYWLGRDQTCHHIWGISIFRQNAKLNGFECITTADPLGT